MEITKKQTFPRVCLFSCFSHGSNTGTLTGLAAQEVIKRLGSEVVGIGSMPALLNQVPRQSEMIKNFKKIIIIDGCHQSCARELLAEVGIKPQVYLNLETDLGLIKKGPFTSLDFTEQEVKEVTEKIISLIKDLEKD
jgi:Uncharacterized conserved protein